MTNNTPVHTETPETLTFLRIHDVARMFGRSKRTIDRWIASGRFPRGKRHPGGMIWTPKAIERWLNDGQVTEKELKLMRDL